MSEINFTLAELTRLKLEPGEVLSVKLFGDDFDPESTADLQTKLQSLFPNNRIMIFSLPTGNDLQMEAISGSLEDSENKELAAKSAERAELLRQIEALGTKSGCGPEPTSFCSDCSCGKKERAQNEQPE